MDYLKDPVILQDKEHPTKWAITNRRRTGPTITRTAGDKPPAPDADNPRAYLTSYRYGVATEVLITPEKVEAPKGAIPWRHNRKTQAYDYIVMAYNALEDGVGMTDKQAEAGVAKWGQFAAGARSLSTDPFVKLTVKYSPKTWAGWPKI